MAVGFWRSGCQEEILVNCAPPIWIGELTERFYCAFTGVFKTDCWYAVYSLIRRTCFKKVDAVHNAGLRYATGAFRTSPAQNLYIKQDVVFTSQTSVTVVEIRGYNCIVTEPLKPRVDLMWRWLRNTGLQEHNAYSTSLHQCAWSNPASPFSFHRRYRCSTSRSQSSKPRFHDCFALATSQTRYWLNAAIRSKGLCNPSELKHLFRSVLAEYVKYHIIVHADGSKKEKGVSNKFVIEGGWRLQKTAVVYSDRLNVMWQAHRYLAHRREWKLIYTDSLRAVDTVAYCNTQWHYAMR